MAPVLTPDALIALQAQIADAEKAYHNLQTGAMPRVVQDQNGERVEFTAANASKLYLYIQQLKAMLPATTVCAPSFRPISFLF